ncbi:TPA: hypothetical protein ACOEOW_003929 [Enterobacter hormaechei subsp. xiangfangensis]
MITVQLNDGARKGTVEFSGEDVFEPCEITVTGDFSLQAIQDLFWHATLGADGAAQGIYELTGNVCSPAQVLKVMRLFSVEVTGIPSDWADEMDSAQQDAEQRFIDGDVS